MKALKIILTVIIPIILILFSFRLFIFDVDFYEQEFEKNQVTYSNSDKALDNLLSYFTTGEELDSQIYTEREIEHMKDVKTLILIFLNILNVLFLIALGIIIYFMYNKNFIAISNSFMLSSAITFGLIAVIFILSLFYFESMFVGFHKLLFNNDLWLLSSNTALIKMFGNNFFPNVLKKMLLNSVYLSIFLALLGYGARFVKEK